MYHLVMDCLTLRMEALRITETSGTICTTRGQNIPQDMNLQHQTLVETQTKQIMKIYRQKVAHRTQGRVIKHSLRALNIYSDFVSAASVV
jgi:hypothetical protein